MNGAASPPCREVEIRALLEGSALCHPPELLAELVSGRAQPQISLLLLDSIVPHFCSCLWESITPKQCAFCGEAESELQSSIFFLAHPLFITETSEIYPFPPHFCFTCTIAPHQGPPHLTWAFLLLPPLGPFFSLMVIRHFYIHYKILPLFLMPFKAIW